MDHVQPPILGIAGWKNSGKTTLVVGLVAALVKRGWRIATVKHTHHDVAIDDAKTDSARHRRAGAQEAAIVAATRWAIVAELRGAREPDLEEVVARLSPADLVIVEGYKSAPVPKIEVRMTGQETQEPIADGDPLVCAIAADHPVADTQLPVFRLDDHEAIADFVAQKFGPPVPRVVREARTGYDDL